MILTTNCAECGKEFKCNGKCKKETTRNKVCYCVECWYFWSGAVSSNDFYKNFLKEDHCERVKFVKFNPSRRRNFNRSLSLN